MILYLFNYVYYWLTGFRVDRCDLSYKNKYFPPVGMSIFPLRLVFN